MDPRIVVVPFAVFTRYRNRRLHGEDIAGEKPAADTASPSLLPGAGGVAAKAGGENGCVDTSFASAETAVPAEPIIERIPS